jgi:non-canonical purine NTP pyrophosphatase (RdgB/HAM1 family)
VTGNPGKLRELEALALGQFDFQMRSIALQEIQSLDLQEIVTEKLKHAYGIVKGPVIVDDVSAGLDSLKGLPGPFIKFFNDTLGEDSLLKLAKRKHEKVTVRCIAAYYDGSNFIFGNGIIHGTVVEPRGSGGFGFDVVIVPDGEQRTMAEMTNEEKMQVSHRGMAFRDLLAKLKTVVNN